MGFTWRPRALRKWVISRVISTLNGVTPIVTLHNPLSGVLTSSGVYHPALARTF